jgi:hypothetical protein
MNLISSLIDGSSSSNGQVAAPQQAAGQFARQYINIEEEAAVVLQMSGKLCDLAQQVQQAAAAVCAVLPLPHSCNHLGCSNLGGDSEAGLVGGKGSVCSGCRVAR